MKQLKLLAIGCVCTAATSAQNNAIFNGGGNDGISLSAFAQTSSNIFSGGAGDGWNFTSFQQPGVNLFGGGNGDGWGSNSFAQTVVNIYAGGEGDGWSFSPFLQPGNAIFNGGEGDGWNYTTFLQAGNSIFAGGQGDGWASTYRPLGVLPVTFVGFSATKDGASSLLQWQTASELNAASFDVERSSDAIHFTKIGNVLAAGTSASTRSYRFVDAQPLKGHNHYRLKQLDRNGSFVYTPVRTVLFTNTAMLTVKAFPVPTSGLVTIEIPLQLRNEDVILNLSNSVGVMIRHARLASNRAQNTVPLNVASLPAGVYTLQVVSKNFQGSVSIIKQ